MTSDSVLYQNNLTCMAAITSARRFPERRTARRLLAVAAMLAIIAGGLWIAEHWWTKKQQLQDQPARSLAVLAGRSCLPVPEDLPAILALLFASESAGRL